MKVQLSENYEWIAKRALCDVTPNSRALEVVDRDGRIRGMVLYDNWTPNMVQAHMAVETPIAWRALAMPAFDFPFRQCGRNLLLAVIRADNKRSLTMALHLGFHVLTCIQDGWDVGVPLVTLQMRKAQCRFLTREERLVA